ncbi:MAG TPA: hypothetical protein VF792_07275 [Ktedonobacterales bacterium]
MRGRWRVVLVIVAVVAILLAFAFVNREGLRATYWTARGDNCGTLAVNAHALVTSTADAQRAETCYADAAAKCKSALLVVNAVNYNINATYTFLVEPPIGPTGACEIAVTEDVSATSGDNYSVSRCQGVTQTPTALKFAACGDLKDVTLPAIHAGISTL